MRAASPLHDIGKVGIPDAILNKPGPLTPDERTVMAEHPVIGEHILQHRRFPQRRGDRPPRARVVGRRMSHADAFIELTRCAGRQFGPKVTEALVAHFYHQRAGNRSLLRRVARDAHL